MKRIYVESDFEYASFLRNAHIREVSNPEYNICFWTASKTQQPGCWADKNSRNYCISECFKIEDG